MSYLPQPYQPDDSFSIVPPEEALTTIVDELAAVQQEVSDLLISLGHPDLPAKTVTAMRGQLEVAQTALAEARKQGRKAVTILAAITVQERRS